MPTQPVGNKDEGHWYGFNSWVDDPKQVLIRTFLATPAQAKALQTAGLNGFFHRAEAGDRANAYAVKNLTPAQLALVNKSFGTHYIATGQTKQKINIPVISPIANSLNGVDGFVNALQDKNTWIRVGEVVLGLLLVAIGLAKLTEGTAVGKQLTGALGKVALA